MYLCVRMNQRDAMRSWGGGSALLGVSPCTDRHTPTQSVCVQTFIAADTYIFWTQRQALHQVSRR